MKYLKRAFTDTFQKRIGQLFSAGVAGLAGWLYLYFLHGEDFALAELPFMFGAIAGTCVFVVTLFLWNFACAPFRVERDGRLAAEQHVTELETQIPRSSNRKLSYDQKVQLTDAIRRARVSPESLNVVYFNASEECANFAENIGDAIQAVPLECIVHQGIMFPHDPKDMGLKIYRGRTASLKKLADHIQGGLEKSGVVSEIREITDGSETIYIYVARSPVL